MSGTAVSSNDFQVTCEDSGPRFLGLQLSERNRRVAGRHGGVLTVAGSALPMLIIPAGVAITPLLFDLLPPPEGVWHLLWDGGALPLVWRGTGAAGEPLTTHLLHLPPGAALDVSTSGARRAAAWQLLRASGKPTDGWLSRHLHRRVSRIFSYLFLSAGLSANVATFATLGIGVASAWLLAQTSHSTMIAGGLLFWCASIADGIDGEMARLTLSESQLGEQLDTGVDLLTYVCGLTGVLVGWTRQGIGPSGIALAAIVVSGIPTLLFWAMRMVRRARKTEQLFVPTKPIEGAVFAAARRLRAPVLRAAAAVFALFRRESFSLTFFLVSLATSWRAIYPLLLAAGLAVVLLTFLLHREALAEELAREFA
jgi:phosphatidylglycerophosphate synthase